MYRLRYTCVSARCALVNAQVHSEMHKTDTGYPEGSFNYLGTTSKYNMFLKMYTWYICGIRASHTLYPSGYPKMRVLTAFWGILKGTCISPHPKQLETCCKSVQACFQPFWIDWRRVRRVKRARHTTKHVATSKSAQAPPQTFCPPEKEPQLGDTF